MKNIRAIYKFILFLLVLIWYFATALFTYVTNFDKIKRRQALIRNTQRICRLILKVYNINLNCENPLDLNQKGLIVGNHMGFIDVICLNSLIPCVFITSIELKETPVLGQIAELAGCGYVERRSRIRIQQELLEIAQILKQGFRVALYPEAGSSNGEQVLPFKKTLLMSAPVAELPILPYVFNYTQVNGQPIEFKYRDHLTWYGDQSFLNSIWKAFQLKSIDCEIEFLTPQQFSKDEDREQVALSVHGIINKKFKPFKSN